MLLRIPPTLQESVAMLVPVGAVVRKRRGGVLSESSDASETTGSDTDGIRRRVVMHRPSWLLPSDRWPSAPLVLNTQHPQSHYYQAVAQYMARRSRMAIAVYSACVPLWSNPHLPSLFCLMFFQWLFPEDGGVAGSGLVHEASLDDVDTRVLTLFLKGASRLFWHDLDNSTQVFFPVFQRVVQVTSSAKLRAGHLQELYALGARFFFHYMSGDDLGRFIGEPYYRLTRESSLLTPKDAWEEDVIARKQLAEGIVDVFLVEFVGMLRHIRSDNGLIRYLNQACSIHGLPGMSEATLLWVQMAIHELTTYRQSSRFVRHAARDALNVLFPQGRWVRGLVGLMFKLLHPSQWPFSLATWIVIRLLWPLQLLLNLALRMRSRGQDMGLVW